MGEKKVTKISFSTALLIIAIIIIIVMGGAIYKLYNDKKAETKRAEELQAKTNELTTQVNSQKENISELQGKIDKVSETVNSNSSSKKSNETFSNNKSLEEANVTNNVNKTGMIGKITYEIEDSATKHIDGFDVIVEDSKAYFKLLDKKKVESYSIIKSSIKREENKKEEITGFSGKIKKVYFYQVGQDVTSNSLAILFLMEDGKIEYISYTDALQTTNLQSRGEIKGIYNIKEIYTASAREWVDETGGPGWASCVAKDSSNNYYSLETAFEKNNINLSKVN